MNFPNQLLQYKLHENRKDKISSGVGGKGSTELENEPGATFSVPVPKFYLCPKLPAPSFKLKEAVLFSLVRFLLFPQPQQSRSKVKPTFYAKAAIFFLLFV